ncbi:MAG: PAS domain S-box protein, partial [Deltaproteobacteria bacterium]|nr:PAS domain S-box protein [Deltaproteobacteria bacterium]
EQCALMTGYAVEDLCAPDFDFMVLIAPESSETVRSAFARHMAGEELGAYSYRLLTRSGERIEVENNTRLITFRGQPAILGVVTDVSEYKRTERALRESEQRYRLLVETCPDGITLTDLEGNLVMTNQQAAAIHGFHSAEELLQAGADAFELIAPEDRVRALENARKTLETGSVSRVEYSLLRKDGDRIPVELSASLITDPDGHPEAFIGVVRDITERKEADAERERLRAQVQHTQKLESLGVLAGGIAHDFNNLLVAVLGNASLVLHQLPEDAEIRDPIVQIEAAAHRARDLTRQLLAYSGRSQLTVEPVDLNVLVEEMSSLLRVSISKKVKMVMEYESGLPWVEADATQLRQVVMNLITNASEAIGEGTGTVTLQTRLVDATIIEPDSTYAEEDLPPGALVCLTVSDTGCGMDEEVLCRLFDPFFTTKFTGRGLGMSAVLGIVRGHHGAIEVRSTLGEGTQVRVVLPPMEAPVKAEASETGGVARQAPSTILVVDDEQTVREVAASILRSFGYEVWTASDGREGVELFARDPDRVGAVLLDATMPSMDGAEACQRLREIRPRVPIVLSSGFTEQEMVKRIRPGDVDAFIQKPYGLDELMAVILEVLAG